MATSTNQTNTPKQATEAVLAKNIYPEITVVRPLAPNRMWAIPFLGGVAKIIILIPVFVEIFFLTIANFFVTIVNSFIVLFTGNYWKTAYDLALGLMRLTVRVTFFFQGLTDKYPGFSLDNGENAGVEMAYPEHPNRLWALPFLGIVAKVVILIPFLIWEGLVRSAANLALLGSSLAVFVKGYYPESTFELARDSTRLNLASGFFLLGISDKYPSFSISWNHKAIKIVLLALSVLLGILNMSQSNKQDYSKAGGYYNNININDLEKKLQQNQNYNLNINDNAPVEDSTVQTY